MVCAAPHRLLWLLAMLPLFVTGCLERTSATPPATVAHSPVPVPHWSYVSSFGGAAELSVDSPDPYAKRYDDGKFLQLSGIYATATEVWACDLGISRIQRFNYDGQLVGTLGSGVPLAGTLPSDAALSHEEETINPSREQRWEQTPDGQRWVIDRTGLFKAADVAVTDKGYWLTDQVQTAGNGGALRPATCRFYANDGTQYELPTEGHCVWPDALAVAEGSLAFGEDYGNVLWMARYVDDSGLWEVKRPTNYTTSFSTVMGVREHLRFSADYEKQLAQAENAASTDVGFHDIGGMAIYNGKLLVCDRRNGRIKVYEARPDADVNWDKQIKIVPGHRAIDGALRFVSPRDVDVSSTGLIYVLDGERREVAILAPNFERVGTIPGEGLDDPRALCLSPDGQDLFISDPGRSLIHHYAAR